MSPRTILARWSGTQYTIRCTQCRAACATWGTSSADGNAEHVECKGSCDESSGGGTARSSQIRTSVLGVKMPRIGNVGDACNKSTNTYKAPKSAFESVVVLLLVLFVLLRIRSSWVSRISHSATGMFWARKSPVLGELRDPSTPPPMVLSRRLKMTSVRPVAATPSNVRWA